MFLTHRHTDTPTHRHFFRKIFSFLILLSFSFTSSAQVETDLTCGVASDMSYESYSAMRQGIVTPLNFSPSTDPSEFEIPIHVIYVTEDGEFPNNLSLSYNGPLADVEHANSMFTNGMSFYVCQFTIITAPEYFHYEITDGNSLSQAQGLYDIFHDDNAINLYVTASVHIDGEPFGGWSFLPDNPLPMMMIKYAQVASSGFGGTLAHELGHFFGLLHTFHRWLDVVINPDVSCYTSGDNICETPPDIPSEELLDCYVDGECDGEPCHFQFGPWEYDFMPDKTNVMSYHSCGPENFKDQQLDVMGDFLEFHPNRTFLINNQNLTCDLMVSTYAQIDLVRKGDGSEIIGFFGPKLDLFDDEEGLVCSKPAVANPPLGHVKLYNCNLQSEDSDITFGPRRNDSTLEADVASYGLTVQDAIEIRKHILGAVELEKPYGWIAADVNNSGSITTIDYIHVIKVILGIYEAFPNVPSIRYVPRYSFNDHDFFTSFTENPFTAEWEGSDGIRTYSAENSPISASYMDDISINLLSTDIEQSDTWSWLGIKSGDVNYSAPVYEGFDSPDDELLQVKSTAHACIEANKEFSVLVSIESNQTIEAYQLGLVFNPDDIEIVGVNEGVNEGDLPFSLDDFGLKSANEGILKTVWMNESPDDLSFQNGKTLFQLFLKSKKMICDITDLIELSRDFSSMVLNENSAKIDINIDIEVSTEGRKHSLKEIFPNPVSASQLQVKFELKEAASVNIIIFDAQGNTLEHTQYYQAGEFTHSFEHTNGLFPGVISYNITLGNELNTGNLIKF